MYNLRNLLLLNSVINIISEPTRQQAILDPIIIPDDMDYLDSGILVNFNGNDLYSSALSL